MGRGDRGTQGRAAPTGTARVLRCRGADVEEERGQASALARLPQGRSPADRLARPSAHVRFAPRDAWRGDEGGAGAARARHDRDDDALRASQSRRAPARGEAARWPRQQRRTRAERWATAGRQGPFWYLTTWNFRWRRRESNPFHADRNPFGITWACDRCCGILRGSTLPVRTVPFRSCPSNSESSDNRLTTGSPVLWRALWRRVRARSNGSASQIVLDQPDGGTGTAPHPELLEDSPDVDLYGARRDVELRAYLLVGLASSQ